MSFWVWGIRLGLFLLFSTRLFSQDLQPPDEKKYTVGKILLQKHTIFDEGEESTFFHRAANALHIVTQDHVITRELLFQEGDPYDPDLLEETERNLRQLRFIAEASLRVEFHENQTVTVVVRVRDKFSLSVGASGGLSGGQSKFRFFLGESNFLGNGLDIDAKYVYSEDESGVGFTFFDPRIFDTRHKLTASIDLLDERQKYGVSVERPFFSLDTVWSWGGNTSYQESHALFYHEGEEVNKVPTELTHLDAFLLRSWGDRTLRWKLGPFLFLDAQEYFSPHAEDVVPGHEVSVPSGRHVSGGMLSASMDWFPEYIERTQLDSIDFVEDLALGVSVGVFMGVSYWDMEGGHGPRFPAEFSLVSAIEPSEHHISTFQAKAGIQFGEGHTEKWWVSSAFHHYYSGLPHQTLAVSLAVNAGEDFIDLPVQYTLGENSGLRGYRARYFEGNRRLRFNFEDRIFTPLEFFTLRLGFAAFFDAGLAWEDSNGFEWDDLKMSAGFGLRIGSARFFQGSVLRIDVAFPFDDEGSDGVSVSVTTGQVFTLFSNPDRLTLAW